MAFPTVLGVHFAANEPVPAPTGEDRALVRRILAGEPRAFEALVRAQQDRVYDFCLRMLGDSEEASDVAQDVFVSVHQHLRGFREDARLSTWILRIAKNHCLNRLKYLQRRGRGRSHALGEVSEAALWQALEGLGGPLPPDQALVEQGDRERLSGAIARLDAEQRLLVVLRDVEGLSYEEIVQVTGLAEGTVKSRLHRARTRLAAALEEDGP